MDLIHFHKSGVNLVSDLSKCTVIVACVGVGNVSQLACDLLIYNLKCELVADLDFKFIFSVFGKNPYTDSESDIMTSSQVSACIV